MPKIPWDNLPREKKILREDLFELVE